MKNIIIGTAGHIDHGKTTLIKALTNIDTDRLEEEKKRGITIDLGFAFFDLPSGKKAGIVDVPGHEKFIKNMLAGVSGIDLVLFVISAEEGVMPQTQEHLDILSILNVQKGVVVLTKSDLVDEEWLMMMEEDIKETMKGTFLENAPIVPVSSLTKAGFDELIDTVDTMGDEIELKSISSAVRLPIDRVFTLQGHGTIVTGTLVEGRIEEGDVLSIYPTLKEAKVRSIQVHSHSVKTAYAGQRVAVNVTGIKKTEINRGEILATDNSMEVTSMLDVKLKLLKTSHRELKNWTRLRLYHGTKEILCRLVILDKEALKPGEECFCQLRLEEPTTCKYGDRYVVRFYSPLETIGGGVILDPNAHKHKRFKQEIIDELLFKEAGREDEIIENLIKKHSGEFLNLDEIVKLSGISKENASEQLEHLKSNGLVLELAKKVLIHKEFLLSKEQEMIISLNNYHEKYPIRLGMPKEELRNKLFDQIKNKLFDEILEKYSNIIIKGKYIYLDSFEVKYNLQQKQIIEDIFNSLNNEPFKPTTMPEIIKKHAKEKHLKDMISNLVETDQLVRMNDTVYLSKESFDLALAKIKGLFETSDRVVLSDCRDVLGTSRKYIVPIMEYLDGKGITKRVGDERMLR